MRHRREVIEPELIAEGSDDDEDRPMRRRRPEESSEGEEDEEEQEELDDDVSIWYLFVKTGAPLGMC